MSFFRVNRKDIESFTIVTNPARNYVTSSYGMTGSVYVFSRRSNIEKEIAPLSSFIDATHNDADLDAFLNNLKSTGAIANLQDGSPESINAKNQFFLGVSEYLNKVSKQSISPRKQKVLPIIRFTPSFSFTSNTARKLAIKDQISSYYRTYYPSAHWGYNNYNTLNFVTSSNLPTGSTLLYPNVGQDVTSGKVSGVYVPSGTFSFDFYINPRRRTTRESSPYLAGTIMHMSSTYALSLITGSLKDIYGLPTGFRLQLQLSASADVSPSKVPPDSNINPKDLIFRSSDNSLLLNNWHHVVVRWGTNIVNEGTGSFNIDGVDKGTFVVPSSSIAPKLSDVNYENPAFMSVGNYYEGTNQGLSKQSYFFSTDPSQRDGIELLLNASPFDTPQYYNFTHPLNAELHDLCLKRYYMNDNDILVSSSVGINQISKDIAFYVPPFFVEETPIRKFINGYGGILQTPFFECDGTTNDPFNVALSFGVGGHYINVENYLKDFANGTFPRLHHLTGCAITSTTSTKSANDFLYDQPFVRKRNLLIMPCDDGNFTPDFSLLAQENSQRTYVDDLNNKDYSFVNVDEMLDTASLLMGSDSATDDSVRKSYASQLIGPTPESPSTQPGLAYKNYISKVKKLIADNVFDPGVQESAPLTIYQRTRDASSNQVTFFDVSNLYYGTRILPGSLTIKDTSLTGSDGRMSVTLKDNGNGTLYRADALTNHSTWNSVGTIFYDEGIVAIKNPHLYFFGKDGFEISFKGVQNVHVMSVNALAPAGLINSSSNPNYAEIPPTNFETEKDTNYVHISSINFHDDNMNVVMKTQLAQPIVKRQSDKILFRIKYDM